MSWLGRYRNRWRERDLAREFDDELRFHLESRIDANLRRGMTSADAVAEARRHMGNLTRAREGMREARMSTWFDGLGGDLRHGMRIFGRRPLLTALAVLTLSLGIGANAAIFSVFQAVLLRPLPYPAAERLVLLTDGRRGDRGFTTPTIPELVDVRGSSRSFDGVTFFDTRDFQVAGGDEPQRLIGARVEPLFLSILGVRPELGRIFGEADGANGNVVLLGNGLWRQSFGADPAVIGRTLTINGVGHEIVGVLPETFSFGYLSPMSIDLYVPYPTSPDYMSRAGQFANVRRVNALARLAPGVSVETASSELAAIARAMAAAHPDLYAGRGDGADSGFVMTAEPLRASLTRNSRPVLMMLLGAVVLVLLIACVNTAQFLLAQAIEREPEVALRSALGAGRGRLVRQFSSEALLLAGAAGLAGVAQAFWLTGVLRGLVPGSTPLVGHVGLNGPVLLFLLGVTMVTAFACVLVPALRFSRTNLVRGLEIRGAAPSRGRLRQAFIATEVAISVVLLVSAGLLLQSLKELQRSQGGFSTDGVTIMRMRGIAGGSAMTDSYARYLQQIASVGGVDAAGVTSSVLPGRPGLSFTIVGEAPDTATRTRQQTTYQIASAGYFAAMSIPLEAGRLFSDDDTAARPPVAIINREMAQQFWPGADPIGRQIRAGEGPRDATLTIIGIVGNVRPPFQTGDVPQLYVSYRQQSEANIALVVRTPSGSPAPVAAIKQAIWSVDPRQAVFGVHTLAQQLSQATAGQRAIAILIGGFAALALAMSVSGIYTVITYLVSRRFKEIAVRRAIGATGRDVLWSLAGPTLRWTIAGLLAGTAGAVAGTRVLRASVTGVIPLDATLTTLVTGIYLVVVVLAIAAAARGALRIDPAAALRAD
jgi:predicted permease